MRLLKNMKKENVIFLSYKYIPNYTGYKYFCKI